MDLGMTIEVGVPQGTLPPREAGGVALKADIGQWDHADAGDRRAGFPVWFANEAVRRQWAAKKVGGTLLLVGSAIVLGLILISYVRGVLVTPDTRPVAAALATVTAVLGGVVTTTRRPMPAWLFNTAPAAAAVAICIPSCIDHQPSLLGPVLLTWPVMFSAAVLSARAAWSTVAVADASFAVVCLSGPNLAGVVLWLEVGPALAVICLVVAGLQKQANRLHASLADLATTDPLTGLPNRRAFDEAVARAYRRHECGGRPLSVLLLDIDHFKVVNDLWGHQEGDAVLRRLGIVLAAKVRGTDAACRIGGEEFAVLIPDCTADQALVRACELCTTVRQEAEKWRHPITVSIGAATTPDTASHPADLLAAADTALYRAKDSGRNRAVLAAAAELNAPPGAD